MAKAQDPGAGGHRLRLRERYNRTGLAGLLDHEKLELLLTYAIPRCDVKPHAKRLLARFGDLAGVLEANRWELEEVDGIGENASVLLRLIRGLGADYLEARLRDRETISGHRDAAAFARMKIGGASYENFMTIYLNSHNHVLHYEILEGTVDHANVYLRNIIRTCIERHASGLIAIHNHPSGVCQPSSEDEQLTRMLKQSAELHRIRFLDHLLVSRNECRSILYRDLRDKRGVAEDEAPYDAD